MARESFLRKLAAWLGPSRKGNREEVRLKKDRSEAIPMAIYPSLMMRRVDPPPKIPMVGFPEGCGGMMPKAIHAAAMVKKLDACMCGENSSFSACILSSALHMSSFRRERRDSRAQFWFRNSRHNISLAP